MSAKESEALEHRWYEAMNKGKAAIMTVADEDCATNYVYHSPQGRDMDLEGFKQYLSELYDVFPDANFTIDDLVVEGDKAVARYTFTGTHKGAFMGILPSNKKVTFWSITIDRLFGGKFVESWSRTDTLGLMQQLGVIPTPKKET